MKALFLVALVAFVAVEAGAGVSSPANQKLAANRNRAQVTQFAQANRSVLFDFDSGTPRLGTGQGIPVDQTVGGVTAHFSPGLGSGGFSIQSDATTQYRLSKFSGNYLMPNSLGPNSLAIQFSQELVGVTLTFCTADFQQVEVPTTVRLDAFEGTSGPPGVGSATAHGTYAGDTMPMGTLTFNSGGKPFNRVEISIPWQPQGASVFLVDNVIATTSASQATGNLKVTINPAQAVTAGAQWRRKGTSLWLVSGATESGLAPGNVTVEFKEVNGWKAPANATVAVSSGQTAQITRIYNSIQNGVGAGMWFFD